MSAPKYSAEFTEQVVPRGRSTVPAGGRGREVPRAGLCGPWASGSGDGAQSTPKPGVEDSSNAGGCWSPRRLKAELREARMEPSP